MFTTVHQYQNRIPAECALRRMTYFDEKLQMFRRKTAGGSSIWVHGYGKSFNVYNCTFTEGFCNLNLK
jgi:hypothetical protein